MLDNPQQAAEDKLVLKCEKWCSHYGDKLGIDIPLVEAPAILKEIGVEFVRAYPEALLEMYMETVA